MQNFSLRWNWWILNEMKHFLCCWEPVYDQEASVNALATPRYSYSCGLVLEIMFVVPAPNAVQ